MKCPYCAEEINENALKCRFCGEVIDAHVEERMKDINKGLPKYNWFLVFFGLSFSISFYEGLFQVNLLDKTPHYLILMAAIIFFLVSVFMLHKYLAFITDNDYEIKPGEAVGLSFIPFYNIYWFFKWSNALASFVNQKAKKIIIKKVLLNILLACSLLAYKLDFTLCSLFYYLLFRYIIDHLKEVVYGERFEYLKSQLQVKHLKRKRRFKIALGIVSIITISYIIYAVYIPEESRQKQPEMNLPRTQDYDLNLDKSSPKEIFNKSNEAVVLIRVYDENGNIVSFGSGVCIHPEGVIITNLHVLNSDTTYFDIKFEKHGVYEDVYVSGISPILEDYLALRVYGKDLPSVNTSTRNEYDVGEKIITIGNPQGLTNSLSEGLVSGRRFYGDYEYYQMTAPISHGSSGGAVFDEHGYLIGISTAILEEGQNLNFFLPINRFINNAEAFDTSLTISEFNSLRKNRAEEYKETGDQYLLSKDYEQANSNYEISLKYYDSDADTYYANSMALYQLGLEDEALTDLIEAASLYYLNDEKDKLLNVKIRAEEMSLSAEVVDVFNIHNMEKLFKDYNKSDDLSKLSTSKKDLTKELLSFKEKSEEDSTPIIPEELREENKKLGIFLSGLVATEKELGVKIVEITQGCPAWYAGLRTGDIITEIEGKEIKSLDGYVEITQNLNKTRRLKIVLVVNRRGVLYDVSIKRTN